MRTHRKLMLGWSAAAAVIGTPVVAQTIGAPTAPPSGSETLLTAEVTGLYDSNIARSSPELAALRGLHLSDELVTPSLSLDLARTLGAETFFLKGAGDYEFHSVNHILNTVGADVQGGASARLGHCSATVTGGYARAQSDLQYQVLTSAQAVQNVATRDSVQFDGVCLRPIGLSPSVTVSEQWTTNSNLSEQLSNSHALSATAGLGYVRPVLGQISILGRYTDVTYDDRPLPSGGHEGFDIYSVGAQYTRPIGSKITGAVSLYYTSVDAQTDNSGFNGASAFSSATYNADLSYQPIRKLLLHLSYRREISASDLINSTYSIQKAGVAEATYMFGRRLSVKFGVGQTDNHYYGLITSLGPSLNIASETLKSIYGEATYQLNKRISLGCDVRRDQRNADISAYDYVSTRVELSLAAAF